MTDTEHKLIDRVAVLDAIYRFLPDSLTSDEQRLIHAATKCATARVVLALREYVADPGKS